MRDHAVLDEIKGKAEGYAQDLKEALALLDAPDISGELTDISQKLNGFKIKLANTLDSLHYPEMQSTIQRLKDEVAVHQKEIQKAVTALGYPNLIDDYEKAKAERDGYKSLTMECLRDLDYIGNLHASDYAKRRKVELLKSMGDIEK